VRERVLNSGCAPMERLTLPRPSTEESPGPRLRLPQWLCCSADNLPAVPRASRVGVATTGLPKKWNKLQPRKRRHKKARHVSAGRRSGTNQSPVRDGTGLCTGAAGEDARRTAAGTAALL